MTKHLTALALALLLIAAPQVPRASAADDLALNRELSSIINANHLPCGQIVHVSTQSDRDYLVSCKDGSNYQVNADAQGQLVAHPLGQKTH